MIQNNAVYRIYVEKKPDFAVEAKHLYEDIKHNLQLPQLTALRVLNRYDVEGITEEVFQQAAQIIFAEPPVDTIYRELPPTSNGTVFAVQYLPGQFDQRADSCSQSIQLLTQGQRPLVRSAKVYILEGSLTEQQIAAVKHYLINPVEAEEAGLETLDTLETDFPQPPDVAVLEGFCAKDKTSLANLIKDMGLAMDIDDILFCQRYFQQEGKDPTVTELRLIDTYWSDHCRHTTFQTNIMQTDIEPEYIQASFQRYLDLKKELGRENKPTCLMDLATMAMRYLRDIGKLPDLDQSEEINACSIKIKADIDGNEADWLLMFKNETHNHPTEIEPFGGAATCLGGAIRDPLSGRSYVYQAMRVTGAGNPLAPMEETLPGKLPQKKIVTTAAAGYSSYGNQIGLATGLVNEIYHPNYVAKRMEIGAVVGAAPLENVVRERPLPGDIVILLGGSTGRDGCGGATGSSKSHTKESLTSCGAEVQKGNPPEERKIQRLFRDPTVTKMIKRCNDFGAGGVSVAIGELADGLVINLDAIPKKYEGLDGTELAISESQERMAVVIDPKDKTAFLAASATENLQAIEVAAVTEEKRLKMYWRNQLIVSLSRAFLDSNGATKHTNVTVPAPVPELLQNMNQLFAKQTVKGNTYQEKYFALLSDLNICSQKGLVERFDSTIGAGTVIMPFGGKHQATPTPFMAAKLPILQGNTNTASVMAYGFDPFVACASPYHSAMLAVVDSVAKLVAAGLAYQNVWLTLQEYFERTNQDPMRWGKPFAALLGAFEAQMQLGIAAIGGKDSMSGSFETIDVPPTLVSFAIGIQQADKIMTPEWKAANQTVYLLKPTYHTNGLPDFDSLRQVFDQVHQLIATGKVTAAAALGLGGVAEAIAKMSFGNQLGFAYDPAYLANQDMFAQCYGGILIAVTEPLAVTESLVLVGRTLTEPIIQIQTETIALAALQKVWQQTLEPVYPTQTMTVKTTPRVYEYATRANSRKAQSIAKPKVLLPVFPGTNCEYDTARRFETYGAACQTFVIRNLSPNQVEESVAELAKQISKSQIVMLPGGFSGGDEPDGSGKFIAAFFRNPAIKAALEEFLNHRDGLMLGICNGFQALVKLGLLPYGEIRDMAANSPTLTYNDIGRHQSMMVQTRVSSIHSPWMGYQEVGEIHTIAISHGEGKFVADESHLQTMETNGQIVTQYVDLNGTPTMALPFNPNGSIQAIEGICSPDGRILGKMGHSERCGENIGLNVPGNKEQLLFKAGVDYFK